jgi:hypothetical protein
MKAFIIVCSLVCFSGCSTTHYHFNASHAHSCNYDHLTKEEIAGLNALSERGFVDSSLVNALFEEDMRCGESFSE